ncbi:MAG: potassium transporter [Cycloclasticus sp. symbiont of Poecilosclerida sp. N]|nr:MAG: potassium transporter [Cycloclasticus sp. symbiont of Poecilosclerida sp. N]
MSDSSLGRVSFIVLRHMRAPIIALICVYAIAMLGMVLVPGISDENGQTMYMSFFHAFYFLAYTATTTGFGELPIEFSNAQRMWAIVCLYTSVITWLYAVGKIISLLKNPHLQSVLEEESFVRSVRKKSNDYYLVCGFGDTGSLLLRGLTDAGLSAVVLDSDAERIKALDLRDYQTKVLGLCADATIPRLLLDAGVEEKRCVGVLILTHSEEANLKIAVSVRLLRPDIKIICRSTSPENEGEILAVGGDVHVVDPFRVFASYLSMMIYNPTIQTLNEWLSGAPDATLEQNICPLKGGKWVLCGYGSMGSIVYQRLKEKGIDVTVVEERVENIQEITHNAVLGRINLETLKRAGLKGSVGLIVGTNSDTFNLNTIHLANQVNSSAFKIVRQNQHANEVLFKKAGVDFILQPSLVIARMVLFMLTAPLLRPFFRRLRLLYDNDPAKLADIMTRLVTNIGGSRPTVKTYHVNQSMPAVLNFLDEKTVVTLGDIYRDVSERESFLQMVPLAHQRGEVFKEMPENDLQLRQGDEILFCIKPGQKNLFDANINNIHTLGYLLTGKEPIKSSFFRWAMR